MSKALAKKETEPKSLFFREDVIRRALKAKEYDESKHVERYLEIIENAESDADRLRAMSQLEKYVDRAEQRHLLVLSRQTTRKETTSSDGTRTLQETTVDRIASALSLTSPSDMLNRHVHEAQTLGDPDDDQSE